MGRNPKSTPSFFKVLINQDFNRQLRLPPAFVEKLGETLPQFLAQLRTGTGEMWAVRLEKQEDQNYYFARGWAKFCEDLGLAIGEFLVFWYSGKTIFDVSVYGINGCEREITAINGHVEDSDPAEAVNHAPMAKNIDIKVKIEDEDGIDLQDETHVGKIERFSRKLDQQHSTRMVNISKKLDEQHSTRLDIPKAFALSAGIAGDRTVHLQDTKSRLWPVQVASFSRQNGGYRFALTAGWNDFLVGNKVAIGSTVLLECEVPGGSLLKARVLNNGTKGRELFHPRSQKGRPLKLSMPLDDLNVLPCKEECVFF